MDIRKYFGVSPKIDKSHNTRKRSGDSKSTEAALDPSQSSKGSKKKISGEKRKRVAVLSESSDDDVELVEATTPSKKAKSDDKNSAGASSAKKSKATVEAKAKAAVKTRATDFFGSKSSKIGSQPSSSNVLKDASVNVNESEKKSNKDSGKNSQDSSKDKKEKRNDKGGKFSTKVTKEEIMIIDEENWSDDEAFAQILEDQPTGSNKKLTEEHADDSFNETLHQLDQQSSADSRNIKEKQIKSSKSSRKSTIPKDSPSKSIRDSSSKASPDEADKKDTKSIKLRNLNGITFLLTGQMESYERDEAKDVIVKLGGRVVSAVSGKVNYLVTGEEPGASKLAKAEKFPKIKIINEEEFTKMIREIEEITGDTSTHSKKGEGHDTTDKSMETSQHKVLVAKCQLAQETTPKSKKISYNKGETRNSGLQGTEQTLWVEKYRPKSLDKIVGQTGDKSNARKLLKWLNDWHRHRRLGTKPVVRFGNFGGGDPYGAGFKAALLSGSPGIGKTTTAVVVCKEAGFTFFEMNASDSRNKRTLHDVVGHALGNSTLMDYTKPADQRKENKSEKHCIIMDEVDGMAGNEDRGGIQELIQLIKTSHIPVICICNNRQSPKIRSLANYCFDLRFQRPRIEQIRSAMLTMCAREGVQIPGTSLNHIIEASNHDIRQVIHNLSVWTADHVMDSEESKQQSEKGKKDLKMDAFTSCRMAFSQSDTRCMTLKDRSDLFFYDYSLHPLFIQENFINAKPHGISKESQTLYRLANAASSIAMGDVVSRSIRASKWSLLPMQAMFASVIPCESMMGHLARQIEFPKWLGKFSTTNKNFRLLKDITTHMGLSISGSAKSVYLDYLPILRERLTKPLIEQEPNDGARQVIELLQQYDLLKEDYDNILELTQWSGKVDIRNKIDSKTKAALTRQYNKSSHKTHYPVVQGPMRKKKTPAVTSDELDDEAVTVESDGDDDTEQDVLDAFKVQPKKSATKSKQSTQKAERKTNSSKRGKK